MAHRQPSNHPWKAAALWPCWESFSDEVYDFDSEAELVASVRSGELLHVSHGEPVITWHTWGACDEPCKPIRKSEGRVTFDDHEWPEGKTRAKVIVSRPTWGRPLLVEEKRERALAALVDREKVRKIPKSGKPHFKYVHAGEAVLYGRPDVCEAGCKNGCRCLKVSIEKTPASFKPVTPEV
jgi:hypothetical protein